MGKSKRKPMISMSPEQHWLGYKKAVYGQALDAVQEKECGGCFFAGMAVSFDVITSIADLPEDTAVELLEKFKHQIKVTALSQMNSGKN